MFLFLFTAVVTKMSTLKLEDLPNELILKVFGYLKIKELIHCGQLSKRIREISHDETLWQAMNLYFEPWKDYSENKVPAEFLHMVISNGCKYLSLNRQQITGVGPTLGGLKLNEESSLIYLKLIIQPSIIPDPNPDPNLPVKNWGGDVQFSDRVSEEILQKCHLLQKLSLSGYISPDMASSIGYQNGKTLTVLDLRWSTFKIKGTQKTVEREIEKELNSIELIVKNCLNLKEVFLAGTAGSSLSEIALDFVVNNITPTVEILSFNYMTLISDKHVKILGSRCKNLKTLTLAGTSITNESINIIIETMNSTLERLDVAFAYNFDALKLLELKTMPKLQTLIGSGLAPVKEQLKEYLPNLVIFEFNDVHGHCEFTHSSAENLSESDGIWEIRAKQLELFKKSAINVPTKKFTFLKKARKFFSNNKAQ